MGCNEKLFNVGSVWPGVRTRTTDDIEVVMKIPWHAEGYVQAAFMVTSHV